MKKTILLLALLAGFASCKKETGCGIVVGTGTVNCSGSSCTYTLPVHFDDGHWANVSVNETTWLNTLEGERICF